MNDPATRSKRYRLRTKVGAQVAIAHMTHSLTISLIRLGLLSESDSFDKHKRGEALVKYAEMQRKKV